MRKFLPGDLVDVIPKESVSSDLYPYTQLQVKSGPDSDGDYLIYALDKSNYKYVRAEYLTPAVDFSAVDEDIVYIAPSIASVDRLNQALKEGFKIVHTYEIEKDGYPHFLVQKIKTKEF